MILQQVGIKFISLCHWTVRMWRKKQTGIYIRSLMNEWKADRIINNRVGNNKVEKRFETRKFVYRLT